MRIRLLKVSMRINHNARQSWPHHCRSMTIKPWSYSSTLMGRLQDLSRGHKTHRFLYLEFLKSHPRRLWRAIFMPPKYQNLGLFKMLQSCHQDRLKIKWWPFRLETTKMKTKSWRRCRPLMTPLSSLRLSKTWTQTLGIKPLTPIPSPKSRNAFLSTHTTQRRAPLTTWNLKNQ